MASNKGYSILRDGQLRRRRYRRHPRCCRHRSRRGHVRINRIRPLTLNIIKDPRQVLQVTPQPAKLFARILLLPRLKPHSHAKMRA